MLKDTAICVSAPYGVQQIYDFILCHDEVYNACVLKGCYNIIIWGSLFTHYKSVHFVYMFMVLYTQKSRAN